MKHVIILIIVANILPSISYAQDKAQFHEISIEVYRDKVAGGWVDQAIGFLYGQWTEFKWIGEKVPFDLEGWNRRYFAMLSTTG
jgi:hypothetical protein